MHTDRERVTKALNSLTAGLDPYVEKELRAVYKDDWHAAAKGSFREDRGQAGLKGEVIRWDAHALLTGMWDQWNRVFRHRLTQAQRSLISELRDFRNRWAHQEDFDFDDCYRTLDSIERILTAVSADEARHVARDKRDLLRTQFSLEARSAYKKAKIARRKWKDFSIYLLCCASVVFVLLYYFGTQGWFLALFVVAVFAYLSYQRIIAPLPVYFGPHECHDCGKIIYGESCPYCALETSRTLALSSTVGGLSH